MVGEGISLFKVPISPFLSNQAHPFEAISLPFECKEAIQTPSKHHSNALPEEIRLYGTLGGTLGVTLGGTSPLPLRIELDTINPFPVPAIDSLQWYCTTAIEFDHSHVDGGIQYPQAGACQCHCSIGDVVALLPYLEMFSFMLKLHVNCSCMIFAAWSVCGIHRCLVVAWNKVAVICHKGRCNNLSA